MDVTRNVIADLLPLYVAGEASADTRALVERFYEENPELARQMSASEASTPRFDTTFDIAQEAEMRTIHRTRTLVKRRSMLLAFGILFTLLPLSVSFDTNGVRWMWRGAPAVAVIMGAVGLLSWAGYFTLKHRLRATGL